MTPAPAPGPGPGSSRNKSRKRDDELDVDANREGDSADDDGDDKPGIECRKCGCRHFRVYYTRLGPSCIRRVRICRHCGTRRLTTER